jgi:secreted PhoX family phosphatase
VALGSGIMVTGSIDALFSAMPGLAGPQAGYGDLLPDPSGLLDLPRGFTYKVLSRQGEPMRKSTVPGSFDGMAPFRSRGGQTRLLRNHENRAGSSAPVVGPAALTYDPGAAGGVTALIVENRRRVDEYVTLAGTAVNCAGGVTPWRTWLTCEETEVRRGNEGYEKDHGWVFEVDPFRNSRNEDPTPLPEMGRFPHEALCVDPRTGVVYETEDSFGGTFGCFYRFLPHRPLGGYGSLRAGGTLQAMRVPGVPDLSSVVEPGTTIGGIQWVDVPDPLAAATPVREQDYGPAGITHAQKLEGAWWGLDDSAYFVSSYARTEQGSQRAHRGQVWKYDPEARSLTLKVCFLGGGDDPLFEAPDNICMSPYGGLMLCQDGGGENYLMGTSRTGKPYLFARNRQDIGSGDVPEYGEFAGVCFSADRSTLYVNCYNPGTTFAVTGPFAR